MKEKQRSKYIILHTVLITLLTMLVIYIKESSSDLDMMWHYKMGEDIIKNLRIDSQNLYSWITGTYWNQQEWLFDVIMYIIIKYTDIIGYYLVFCLYNIAIILMSYKNNIKECGENVLLFILLIILFSGLLPSLAMNRPANYSVFVFLLFVYMWEKDYSWKHSILYFATGIFIANFHAGMYFTLEILIIIQSLSGNILNQLYYNKETDKEKKEMAKEPLIRGLKLGIPFTIGLIFNPNGIMLLYEMFNIPFFESTQHISEWNPYIINNPIESMFLISVIASIGYSVKKYKGNKKELSRLIIISAFLTLSLMSVKGFTIFYYLFLVFGLKYYTGFITGIFDINLKKEESKDKDWKVIRVACIISTVVLTINYAATNISFERMIEQDRREYLSDEMNEYLLKNNDTRILHGYLTGNHLLWEGVKVFVDSRQYPYAKEMGNCSSIDDLLTLNATKEKEEIKEIIKRYDFEIIITDTELLDISWYLETDINYKRLYTYKIKEKEIGLWIKTRSPIVL